MSYSDFSSHVATTSFSFGGELQASGVTFNVTNDVTSYVTSACTPEVDYAEEHEGDDDRPFLHSHWLQYRDVMDSAPEAFFYVLGVYITVICIVGVIGNMTVIYIFSRTPSLRTPSNLFVISLAVSDGLFSLINGFPLMSVSSFKRRWIFGDIACQWYAFIAGVCGLNSINTLALIAVDRYLVISSPLRSLYSSTIRRALVLIAVAWTWSAVWTVPPLIGWGRYIGEGFQVSCTFDFLTRTTSNVAFNLCLVGCGFLFPVVVIAVSYAGIVRAVSRQAGELMRTMETTAQGNVDERVRQKQEKERRAQEFRLTKIAATMISLFILSWLPYALIAQFGLWGLRQFVTPYTAEIPVMVAKASAIWNPIVYALTHPRYRSAIWSRLPPWLRAAFRRRCSCCCLHRDNDSAQKSSADSASMNDEGKRSTSTTSNKPRRTDMVRFEKQPSPVDVATSRDLRLALYPVSCGEVAQLTCDVHCDGEV